MQKPWAAKFAFLLLGCLLLIGIGVSFWIAAVRDRKWAALTTRMDELRAEKERTAPPERLAFGREILPGNAWDDYNKANPLVPGKPPTVFVGSKLRPFLERKPEADRAGLATLVSQYATSIELVSSGTRRSDAIHGGRGYGAGEAISLCISKARLLGDAGNTTEALELLTDVCLYGRDLAHSGLSRGGGSGIYTMSMAFDEMRDMVQSRETPQSDLLMLEQRLQTLDERFPDAAIDLCNDLMDLGSLLIREDQADQMLHHMQGRTRRSWQYLFSSRLQAGSAFEAADRMVQRALDGRKLPFREEQAVAHAIYRDIEESSDKVLGNLHSILGNQQVIRTRGQLRLLRFAVHYRATGQTLDLDSPYGQKVAFRLTEGTLLAWHPVMFTARPPKPGPTSYSYWTQIELPRRPDK